MKKERVEKKLVLNVKTIKPLSDSSLKQVPGAGITTAACVGNPSKSCIGSTCNEV
ncbi:MAG TPA: hypothetical protein VI356_03220 [Myxococcales bacterium]